MARVGDGTPGPGRPKGSVNKSTATMKAAIESVYQALQEGSGKPHGHFIEWAKDNETEFYKLAAKLIPIQVGGDPNGVPVAFQKIERVVVDPQKLSSLENPSGSWTVGMED